MIKLSDVKVRPLYRRRVRFRLIVIEYAAQHGPTAASRRFGVSVRTIRRWRARWRVGGLTGMVPRYPHRRQPRLTAAVIELIRHARHELAYGAARTRIWLLRVHHVRLAMATVQHTFRALGMPRLRRTRKRAPKQMKLFEMPAPGDSVQVDVKYMRFGTRFAPAARSSGRTLLFSAYRSVPLSRLAGHHQPARQPRPLDSAPGESHPSRRAGSVDASPPFGTPIRRP